jgi:predicted transcriptional regulator
VIVVIFRLTVVIFTTYRDVTVTRTLARTKRELKRRGITQDVIAAAARCTRTYVNHYLNGRRSAPKVEAAIERLIERNGDAAA